VQVEKYFWQLPYELLRRAADGDREALSEVIQAYRQDVLRMLRGHVAQWGADLWHQLYWSNPDLKDDFLNECVAEFLGLLQAQNGKLPKDEEGLQRTFRILGYRGAELVGKKFRRRYRTDGSPSGPYSLEATIRHFRDRNTDPDAGPWDDGPDPEEPLGADLARMEALDVGPQRSWPKRARVSPFDPVRKAIKERDCVEAKHYGGESFWPAPITRGRDLGPEPKWWVEKYGGEPQNCEGIPPKVSLPPCMGLEPWWPPPDRTPDRPERIESVDRSVGRWYVVYRRVPEPRSERPKRPKWKSRKSQDATRSTILPPPESCKPLSAEVVEAREAVEKEFTRAWARQRRDFRRRLNEKDRSLVRWTLEFTPLQERIYNTKGQDVSSLFPRHLRTLLRKPVPLSHLKIVTRKRRSKLN